jgi:hypothetical protein
MSNKALNNEWRSSPLGHCDCCDKYRRLYHGADKWVCWECYDLDDGDWED